MDRKSREKDEIAPKPPVGETRLPAAELREIGGPTGPDPTRYGDWEYNGRCIDF
jgi:hypothetical protein